jgi:hypothetical protein
MKGVEGKEGETIKTGKKVKKMGDLELMSGKGGKKNGGKRGKNRNVYNEDRRIDGAPSFVQGKEHWATDGLVSYVGTPLTT